MPPIPTLQRVSVCVADSETEAMADSESFEEFYTGAVGRLLGQLFPVTGDTSLFQFFGYFGLFCATVLILRVIVAILRDGLN